MEWNLLSIVWGIYTIVVLFHFIGFIDSPIGERWSLERWKQNLSSESSSFKFCSIIFYYVGMLLIIVGLNDFWKNNSFIVNILFLLPLLFFYKIYDDGVKSKGYSELDSFTYVTYLIGWIIMVPISIFYWYMIIVG